MARSPSIVSGLFVSELAVRHYLIVLQVAQSSAALTPGRCPNQLDQKSGEAH